MSAKTRIWVFHMKELIYTGVFVSLGILFSHAYDLHVRFRPEAGNSRGNTFQIHGRYLYSFHDPGRSPVEIAVTVDADRISSICFRQLDETVSAMYPLMEPALESLSRQICESQSLEDLSYSEESQYTSLMLMSAIRTALDKAEN